MAIAGFAWLANPTATQAQEPSVDERGSEHDEDALFELAVREAAIAQYPDSVEHFEQFARQYGPDERTPIALENAYLFRVGLEQDDAALANLDAYERLYDSHRADQGDDVDPSEIEPEPE